MLDLVHAYVGAPASHLKYLLTPNQSLLIYPAGDCVVLINSRDLTFVKSLAFWEVFPGTHGSKQLINCIASDAGMKLIIASLGSQVAVWSLSGVRQDTWIVHSSLTLPEGHTVTSLDCKSALLAVASPFGLSVFTLILENDLPTWSKKWSITTQPCLHVRFSPSLTLLVTSSHTDNTVRIYSTTAGRQIQAIRHPRPVENVIWRSSRKSSRDDLILYTTTSDGTLRIFLPVLDVPHRLQLHAVVDLFSATHSCEFIDAPNKLSSRSRVFWLERDVLSASLDTVLSQKTQDLDDDPRYKRIEQMNKEGWDFFMRVLWDGSLVLTAVANIDRRPPTILKQFNFLHYPASTLTSLPSHIILLPSSSGTPGNLTFVASPPLTSFSLDPLSFFDNEPDGLEVIARILDPTEKHSSGDESKIVRLVRTPEGRGLAVLREEFVQAWHVRKGGADIGLRRIGSWPAAAHVVVLDNGKRVLLYNEASQTLSLQPAEPATVLVVPKLASLFCLPSNESNTSVIGITPDCDIVHIRVSGISITPPAMKMYAQTRLPLQTPPKMIMPVDPMAWSDASRDASKNTDERKHDVLLSVTEDGELSYWVAKAAGHPNEGYDSWFCTGSVRTGRRGMRMARCSSAKKSALVISTPDGDELTIWDSKVSEFATGLEYKNIFSTPDTVNDLDWTSTPDSQSILAVGFAHHFVLLCQQRMTYFDQEPAWGVCCRIDIGHMTPHTIGDSIWLTGGSLLVGAGHEIFQFGRPPLPPGVAESETGLFEYVARVNGPLEDYHPQMILQCLLWGKVELVKEIIVNLALDLQKASEEGKRVFSEWRSLPVERFLASHHSGSTTTKKKRPYSILFNGPQQLDDGPEDGMFSRELVRKLLEQLEAEPLAHLTPNEHAHLVVLIQTTLEIEEQRRALDDNGLRYLISMRSFYILNRRASEPTTPEDSGSGIARTSGRRERLRFRDIVWAFHSESQEILLSASNAACENKMTWPEARSLGVFLWLNSLDSMKAHLEVIARNHYMAGDNRDPTACCLYYFALGKVKLVHGLWKQAAWHREQAVMLKFLSNDFSEPRWRTAALKNAFALLSKQRHEYAAAFFLLGGGLRDAVNVCVKQLNDFQLGIALARVVEGGDDGPVLKNLLTTTVIPLAFEKGNRWLGSWAFWLLRRRDLSVRILLTPLEEINKSLDIQVTEIGDPNYDDPSLALLFSQLKSKTLQAAKGTSEISGRTEFNFVLQVARVFCRMGCHVLALDLVKSWSFDRATSILRPPEKQDTSTHETVKPQQHSPTFARRPGFALPPHIRRRSSIVIDMEVPSLPPTRAPSPVLAQVPEDAQAPAQTIVSEQPDAELPPLHGGLGTLMKSAKQDVKVPEFDMGAFF
ncbi:hypothetical protein BD410DRAFT_870276 [Rickenella mellea]|uniref:RAVE complex protein Rav1 C-terminal domain-containing protein n=1 Tax=Rickenella mellea TaxID=50990 RepID=A0A4Y7QKC9_9AGAM|nr:hypothetical protein BD410DRAFT_870276 [Rickenella mellea]